MRGREGPSGTLSPEKIVVTHIFGRRKKTEDVNGRAVRRSVGGGSRGGGGGVVPTGRWGGGQGRGGKGGAHQVGGVGGHVGRAHLQGGPDLLRHRRPHLPRQPAGRRAAADGPGIPLPLPPPTLSRVITVPFDGTLHPPLGARTTAGAGSGGRPAAATHQMRTRLGFNSSPFCGGRGRRGGGGLGHSAFRI